MSASLDSDDAERYYCLVFSYDCDIDVTVYILFDHEEYTNYLKFQERLGHEHEVDFFNSSDSVDLTLVSVTPISLVTYQEMKPIIHHHDFSDYLLEQISELMSDDE